jgi:D-alanyl-D-alanine carboxypeptidase/D-alanyl-D-alanine-endopeptidase (penicillin-binding protein 4)
MAEVSKILTISILLPLGAAVLASCARTSNELVIAPGANGTMIAVAGAFDGKITSGNSTFNFSHSKKLSIGVATGGPAPADENESKPFRPASITKLVTTSLGLKTLGTDFVFTTRVSWTPAGGGAANDLVIVADGDPQVVRARTGDGVAQQEVFNSIVQQLRARGISRLSGSLTLISADERRDVAIPARGMEESDSATCFGAISQSFNFSWNCAELAVDSRGARWSDPAVGFPLEEGNAFGPRFDSEGRVVSFLFGGSGKFSVPISNVKPWYGRALLAHLAQNGIATDGVSLKSPTGSEAASIRSMLPTPTASGPSFTIESEPLSAIVQYTNKPSDNYFADTIFKTLASKHGLGSDLRVEGQAAVREGIAKWLSREPELVSEVQLVDGAGLSHDNHVSARAYLALLTAFTHEPWFPALWQSLPIAGTDGTLKVKMVGSPAQGRVRAKTGTLNGSYQLAGYVPKYGAGGQIVEFVPFVILSAVSPNERFDVFALQTDIASKLLKLVNAN